MIEEKLFLSTRPRGRQLRIKYKGLVKTTRARVRNCEEKLQLAEVRLEKVKAQKSAPKGVIIIAEGDVTRAEKALQAAMLDYQ